MTFKTAQTVVAEAKDLFSMPDIFFQLNEMIRDPRFSIEEIGNVIAKDPALSARLLRVVNSCFYGFQSRIDNIPRAIAVVGVDDLYNLVVATCVVDRFAKIPSGLMDMAAFWMRSVQCGMVAKLLAKSSAVLNAERLFLAGLLHDIGSLVLYQAMPEQALRVLLAINHDRRLLTRYEQQIIGFTHADVGCELLKSWRLPESLYEVVGCYSDPDSAQVHKLDAHLLGLATRLVDDRGWGRSIEHTLADLPDQTLVFVSLSPEQIGLVMEQADNECLQMFDQLMPEKYPSQGMARPH